MTAAPLIEAVETVAAVRSRQVIWTDWHRQATEGLADDDLVITYTRATPFGTYLIGIEQVAR